MAGIDPRRSSRARTTQPQSGSQHSSTPSSTSGRPERNTRSFSKAGSPQKSTPSGSLSSEPLEDTITAEDPLATRRRTRGNGDERDKAPPTKLESVEMPNDDDDIQEEDEAVRCICGFDDYPGPPPLEDDSKPSSVKDATVVDPIFTTDLTDDTAGFFVQCDICKVWQHGACVGIMTEESSPDEYFCEQCRKDLHKIFAAKNGQRYSHYLPLKRQSRNTSRAASLIKEGTRSPRGEKEKDTKEPKETRNGRNSSATHSASKRRSTMNSREAAYDEAEAIRRAIEASKEDAQPDQPDGSVRRAKRGRSDSEEKPESAKRQRTSSRSLSPPPDGSGDDSDDALSNSKTGSSKSRPRNGAATRNQRPEKPVERDERDRQPPEPANKRKGRSERRQADGTASTPNSTIQVKASETHADTDSDPSEEMPLAARTTGTRTAMANSNATNPGPEPSPPQSAEPPPPLPPPPPAQAAAAPDTPPANPPPSRVDRKRSHKKKGRNQYTRDRDGHDEDSPARSQSRDIQREDNGGGGASAAATATAAAAVKSTGGDGGSKSGTKNKGGMSGKITMTDLKRRATALLDFISRTQVELAGETLSGSEDAAGDKADGESASPSDKRQPDVVGDRPAPDLNGEAGQAKDFKDLNCMEMMDSLTRRLVKWQQEYAA